MHEAVWRGALRDAEKATSDPRGEYVLVIDEAAPRAEATDEELTAAVERAVASGLSKKDASAHVARAHNVGRNRVYELANRPQAQ